MATLRLNFGQIVDDVRQRMLGPLSGNTDAAIADTDHIKRRVNMIYQQYAYKAPEVSGIPGLNGETDLTVNSGDTSVSCPADFIQAKVLWKKNTDNSLLECPVTSERRRRTSYRAPFVRIADNIDIAPAVFFRNDTIYFDGAEEGLIDPQGTYTLNYYQKPDEMTDETNDFTVWPEVLDQVLIAHTAADLMSDGRPLEQAQALYQMAATRWNEFKMLQQPNQGIRNYRIRDEAGYGFNKRRFSGRWS